ncbi:MAG: hypothetical protein MI740_11285 [Halanaerobiales bacterium]|nr:hypothetical protein [Halanaerobiales bacterium]
MKPPTRRKKEKNKVDQHEFLVAWSTGMNDHQIAKKLGVSLTTVRAVKADLFEEDKIN